MALRSVLMKSVSPAAGSAVPSGVPAISGVPDSSPGITLLMASSPAPFYQRSSETCRQQNQSERIALAQKSNRRLNHVFGAGDRSGIDLIRARRAHQVDHLFLVI